MSSRIERIEIRNVEAKLKKPFGWSQRWTDTRGNTVIKVVTSDGVTGWGEGAPGAVGSALAESLGHVVLGRDALDHGAIWTNLFQSVYQAHGFAGPAMSLVSAYDMAFWDAAGNTLGLPVSRLLGSAVRDSIPVYATGLYYTEDDFPGPLLKEAEGYVRQGFHGMKMKVGGKPFDEDVTRVHAVRKAIGPAVRLGIDANEAYNAAAAIQMARRVADADIAWFEEPCASYDDEANLQVRRSVPMPVSGGEGLKTLHEFAPRLARGVFDIVQPDVAIVGGITELVRVAYAASAYGIRTYPHFWGAGISFAASLHAAATFPLVQPAHIAEPYVNEVVLEFDQTPHPVRQALTPGFKILNGRVAVPLGPGLGIEVDDKALARFTAGPPVIVK
jgi:D-galactarolactone cycloisomerase